MNPDVAIEPHSQPSTPNASNTSTTTLSKLRGFTLDLLEHVEKENSTSWQLAEQTGKTTGYVNVYLFRLKKYGLALKNADFWFLTEEGVAFLKELNRNNRTITREQHNNNRTITDEKPKKLEQVPISLFLHESSLDQVERAVVEVLLKHYNETGSKFFYCKTVYDIAERFHINPGQVNDTLMRLKQDHIVYSIKDPHHDAFKIGLYKGYLELLQAQEEKL